MYSSSLSDSIPYLGCVSSGVSMSCPLPVVEYEVYVQLLLPALSGYREYECLPYRVRDPYRPRPFGYQQLRVPREDVYHVLRVDPSSPSLIGCGAREVEPEVRAELEPCLYHIALAPPVRIDLVELLEVRPSLCCGRPLSAFLVEFVTFSITVVHEEQGLVYVELVELPCSCSL